ncbi:alpha-L-fucosidase [Haloferula rosea]|uniref:alpha-L-fucosidase n=1 Tax=Haloferula rosea TaxID=490093 RepID=A0A934RBB4_9BACT|nr:alpha-L-fucosidase [Haloferula rosea]MBK1827887.1 alpha-L-fucosidase [Haloferula rosea]
MRTLCLILVMALSLHGAETAAERDARMEWWRDARFGMFVHWGLYSGLAGTWKGKMVNDHGGMEWIQQRVGADPYTYAAEAIPKFVPKEGFAEEWARMAKRAGCRYVVFTTKHHDGFALHDSGVTNYDAGDVVGRDLVREIVDALRAEGLKVGFYHSLIDWHHPQYDFKFMKALPYTKGSANVAVTKRDHGKYVDFLHAQVKELMTGYGPIDVLWWDYSKKGAEGEAWRATELMKMVRAENPAVIMNNRLYGIPKIEKHDAVGRLLSFNPSHGDFTTPEQTVPSRGVAGVDWEQCMTMNTTWGFSEHDKAWKSDEQLIRHLVDISSKGGNFLLNIGPTGDGSIPPESVKGLSAMGDWLKVNGESIYGTTANPLEEVSFEGRCTAKGDALYLHVYARPEGGTISLDHSGRQATLLDGKLALKVSREGDKLVIQLPEELPDPVVTVIRVD